ncbi:MAG: hypothetical protein IKE69_03430 [Thermoguttaceae bacterium]|nr:hypothetical protein [Thermoguttaceae bacterium]
MGKKQKIFIRNNIESNRRLNRETALLKRLKLIIRKINTAVAPIGPGIVQQNPAIQDNSPFSTRHETPIQNSNGVKSAIMISAQLSFFSDFLLLVNITDATMSSRGIAVTINVILVYLQNCTTKAD